MKHIIRCTNVSLQFKNSLFKQRSDLVLNNVSIQIPENEIFGIIGPSGAGKTTILNVLTKQLQNYSGMIEIDGYDIKKIKKDFFKKISLFSVDSGLYMDLSVFDNLLLYAKVYGKTKDDVHQLLRETGLKGNENRKMSKLSTGMLQRVSLIRCFLNGAKIMLLDEPTSNVDPLLAKYIRDIILQMQNNGKTIVIATHNMYEAEQLCDKLVLLNRGKVLKQGSPQQLINEYSPDNKVITVKKVSGELMRYSIPNDNESLIRCIESGNIEDIFSNRRNLEDVFIELVKEKE